MKIQIVPRRNNAPSNMLAEAEIIFDTVGELGGLKLVGFSIWEKKDGEMFVTLPSRAFGTGSERRYFDFLRSTRDRHIEDTAEIKRRILEAFEYERGTHAS